MLAIEDRAILSTFKEVFKSYKINSCKQPAVHSDPDATVIITDINEIFYNSICLMQPEHQEELIEGLKAVQYKLGKPLTVWMTPETQAPGLEQLLQQHFDTPGPFYGMILNLANANVVQSDVGITIERVESFEQAKDYANLFSSVFEFPNLRNPTMTWAMEQYRVDAPVCINYIARVDGVLAGVSTLVIDRTFQEFKTGGLYNGCVLPEFRAIGVATAMACHRVSEAKQLGLENLSTVLKSDGLARGYCEQLGFKNQQTLTPYFIK